MTPRGRLALAAGLAVVYALCYSAIKVGLQYAPPLSFGALRALLGGGTVLAFLAVSDRTITLPRELWPGTAGLALIGTVLGYGAMFMSPGRTGAGLAAVMGNTTPLLAMLLAAAVLDEPLTGWRLLALILGSAGVMLIVGLPFGHASLGTTGDLFLPLTAAAGFATASVLVKWMEIGSAVLRVAGWQLLAGGLGLSGASWLVGTPLAVDWAPRFVGLLAFLGLVGTALTTTVWYWLLQRDDVGRLSVALFVVPVLGLALGMLFFGERLRVHELAGSVLILLSLVAAGLEPRFVGTNTGS